MHVACCQLDTVWEDKPANFAKVRALLNAAHLPPGTLLLLPEMFATGFSMNVPAIKEPPRGETEQFLAEIATHYGLFVVGGKVGLAPDGKGFNEALAFGHDGHELGRYRKLHPFSFAGETNYYAPGDRIVTFVCHETIVAPFICYDLRFPEVFRRAVHRGTQLFAVIANWPQRREEHWLALLKARAIENQAYVAAVNRCGKDPSLEYSGRSLVIDPRGELIADGRGVENIVRAELDIPALTRYRLEFPALEDMRDDMLKY